MTYSVKLSKFVSLLLRHRSDDFGLELDAQGFTDLDALWAVVQQQNGDRYNRADLDRVIAGDPSGKQRFEVVAGRIRALYGHSKVRPINYPVVVPPAILYHGTNARALPAIRKQGLRSMKRQYVHLSATVERAREVAARRTPSPIILRVNALVAHQNGVAFHCPEPLHYLAVTISPEYIDFPNE